jgi:hypothetical protein
VHIKVEGTKLIFNPGWDCEEIRDITRIHAVGAKIELVKGEKDAQFACIDLKAENPKTFQMQKSGELDPTMILIDRIREITTPQENGKKILDKFIQVRKSNLRMG